MLLDLPDDIWTQILQRLTYRTCLLLEELSKSMWERQRQLPVSLEIRLRIAGNQRNAAMRQNNESLRATSRQAAAKLSHEGRSGLSRPDYLSLRRTVGKGLGLQRQHINWCKRLIRHHSISKRQKKAAICDIQEMHHDVERLMGKARLQIDQLRPTGATAS